jgi:hypothetical protein
MTYNPTDYAVPCDRCPRCKRPLAVRHWESARDAHSYADFIVQRTPEGIGVWRPMYKPCGCKERET